MAKIYKNVLISTEEIFLNQPISAVAIEPEEAPIIINEAEQETLRQEAYDEGHAAGIAKGRALAEQELSVLKQQLETSLAVIPNAVAQNRLDLNAEIADIVLLIIQQLFLENPENHAVLTQQINQILTQLNNKHSIELCLHPQEIAALQKGKIQLDASHLNGLKIISDESLSLGGYVIKTNHGVFDANIEKQIDKLKEVLLQLRQRGQHASMA
jgi:flagellar assembly protein FliH